MTTSTHHSRILARLASLLITAAAGTGPLLAHDQTVVHPGLTVFAGQVQYTPFFSAAALAEAREGSIREDDETFSASHGYNPVTGEGWYWNSGNAYEHIIEHWNDALAAYAAGDYYGEGGAFRLLGRAIHLVEDMTSPAHAHTDIHATGDDFELWGWDPDGQTGHFPEYDLLGVAPRQPADHLAPEAFVDEAAWFTYSLSAFHGILYEDTGPQPDSELHRMFPHGRLYWHDGGFLGDDYWEIDNIGRYDAVLSEEWWACEQDHVDDDGGPGGVRRVFGNFYIENAGGEYAPLVPAVFEKPGVYEANPNTLPLLRIYGDVLYGPAVAYAAGMFHAFVETVTGLNVADLADLADCLGGPATTPTPPPPTEAADCLGVYDFDLDGDVDLADLAELQTRWR